MKVRIENPEPNGVAVSELKEGDLFMLSQDRPDVYMALTSAWAKDPRAILLGGGIACLPNQTKVIPVKVTEVLVRRLS